MGQLVPVVNSCFGCPADTLLQLGAGFPFFYTGLKIVPRGYSDALKCMAFFVMNCFYSLVNSLGSTSKESVRAIFFTCL